MRPTPYARRPLLLGENRLNLIPKPYNWNFPFLPNTKALILYRCHRWRRSSPDRWLVHQFVRWSSVSSHHKAWTSDKSWGISYRFVYWCTWSHPVVNAQLRVGSDTFNTQASQKKVNVTGVPTQSIRSISLCIALFEGWLTSCSNVVIALSSDLAVPNVGHGDMCLQKQQHTTCDSLHTNFCSY